MDEQKQSLIDRIKQAQNILVTVSANPSVDQLAAAIGLTVALNKLDKHGTAVFSGQIPSTIDFLKPEETLEKNTDSLRDFIIALDKSKADKLRYKVEDEVVRIFITPYRTSLSQDDLQFSQGDFNVDVVLALGVSEQKDLDTAITAHGRILHDATVATVSNTQQSTLGTLNWVDPGASSLSEMMVTLVDGLDKKAMDSQIATALLTGIVATTERFSNEKTTPKTMSASAELMAAGANQQLIANELETPPAPSENSADNQSTDSSEEPDTKVEEPGTLEIDHEPEEEDSATPPSTPEQPQPQVHVDENGQLIIEGDEALPTISQVRGVGNDGQPTEAGNEPKHERISEPPQFSDGELTANAQPEELDPSTEELTQPSTQGALLTHNERNLDDTNDAPPAAMLPPLPPAGPAPSFPTSSTPDFQAPEPAFTPPSPQSQPAPTPPPAPAFTPPAPIAPDPDATLTEIEQAVGSTHANQTLTELEKAVESPHADQGTQPPVGGLDDARSAVEAALNSAPATPVAPDPIAALNAQPLGDNLHAPAIPNTGFSEPTPGNTPADDTLDMPLPSNPFGPGKQALPTPPTPPTNLPGTPPPASGQTPPPPVPPPMLPPMPQ